MVEKNMIGVVGSGSWATAIVKILLEDASRSVRWWVRSDEVCESLRRDGANPRHLPSLRLDKSRIMPDTDLAQVVADCNTLFLAVPSAYVEGVLRQLSPTACHGKRIVSLIKGSLPGQLKSVSMFLEQDLGVDRDDICVVSGPSHAEEVACGLPTFLVAASRNLEFAAYVESLLRCSYIHTSRNTDIDGVERCGLAKNIYAIAAGICQGLGFGDNMNAVLALGAFKEMKTLIDKNSPSADRDLLQPCYVGDLMVTCWSQHSRNRALGVAVALGKTVEEAFANMGTVAEGYYSVLSLHKLSTMEGFSAPIAEAVYRVLYEQTDPRTEIENLIANVL